jgi:hypothetical protein
MTYLPRCLALLLCFPACVIDDGDDDDGAGTDDPSGSPSTSASSTTAGSTADETGSGGGEPVSGAWIYDETGTTTNNCTFLDEPSNGFGEFQLEVTGAGMMTILPGDQTEPFVCTFAGGGYSCAERLTGMTDQVEGLDAIGNILVSITGTIESDTSITGSQNGQIECVGADCATAAAALGVTFPCTFVIPFTAEAS